MYFYMRRKNILLLGTMGTMAHTFNIPILRKQRQANLCEPSLVFIGLSRPVLELLRENLPQKLSPKTGEMA